MKNSYLEQIREKFIAVQFQKPAELSIPGVYNRLNRILQYSSFAFILFGIKLWIIGTYGNATPYWDQWDGEATNLYKPFLNGSLSWDNLLAPHNEHRILATRLLALFLLSINKLWNPLFQMVVNAALHILMLMIGISLLTRVIGQKYLPALLFFSLILFAIPFGWENTLAGFQSCFYFVVLFSIISLWLLVTQAPFSIKWWGGIGCSVLAFFSLASGIFVLASAAFISLIFYLSKLRRTNKQLIAVVFLAALFILGSKLTPVLPYHADMKASSFGHFYSALTGILGWPIAPGFIATVVCIAPSLIFIGSFFSKRPPVNDRIWFLAALVVWSFAQAITIAYGRATANLSSRYLDTFTFGLLVNFVCLLIIVQRQIGKRRLLTIVGLFIWMATVLIALGLKGGKYLPGELAAKQRYNLAEENNTRNYLVTGDIRHLKDKALLDIPYPNADALAEKLSWQEIKKVLPGNLNVLKPTSFIANAPGTYIADGYYQTTPKTADSAWGSYHSAGSGNEPMGQLSIRFDNNKQSAVQFSVAGYPLMEGMKLEIEQNGQLTPVSIKENPGESWKKVYARVNNGPFSIKLTDASPAWWMAVTTVPSATGRFDQLTDLTLSHYYIAIIVGIAILSFLITKSILPYHETKP